MELIDLSQTVAPGGYERPFHPKVEIKPMMTHEESSNKFHGKFSFQAMLLQLSDHTGSHVDALNHYVSDPHAPSIDQLPLERFFTSAICVDFSDIPPRTYIETEHIERELDRHGLTIEQGDTFLYYTGHYEKYFNDSDPEKWWKEFAGLSRKATEFLADQGVMNIGCEAFTIENPTEMFPESEEPYPSHQVCKERGMLNTENLVIPKRLVGKRFQFVGLPIKLKGGTGSPIRAVALLGN
jgi:kynurenine formamidase